MQFKILNYRGISQADIDLEKITLVAGLNFTGKTSIAQAVGAVLTGQTVPMTLPKNQASRLVRGGSPVGSVSLTNDTNTAKITWPDAKYSTKGTPLTITPMAAGLESILDMDAKTRAKTLIEALKAIPSRPELEANLKENGVTFTIDKLWDNIETDGWDVAYSHAKETGARLKGSWEQVTGQRYGAQKAATWQPEGLSTQTSEQLTQAVTVAKKALEDAIAQQAILNNKAVDQSKLPELKEKRDNLREEKEQLQKNIDSANKILSGLPSLPSGSTQTCPYCKKPVSVQNGKIMKSQLLTKEAIAKIKADRASASGALDDLNSRMQTVGTAIYKIDAEITIIKDAQPQSQATVNGDSVDDCRSALNTAETAMKASTAATEAVKLSTNIGYNQTIVAALAPTGLRKTKLSSCMGELQSKLTEICEKGGWSHVTITPELDINYNGQPLILCSQSEKYFTRLALQLALSDGKIIIVDGADVIISGALRNKLFSTLMHYSEKALVCMSFAKPDDVPNLSRIGGCSYWLEDGKAVKI